MLCDSTPNSDCWKNMCRKCIDGKKIAPPKNLTSGVFYKQWEKVEISSHSKDTEACKKICIITKDCQVGEVVEEHLNTKFIHAAEFQTDIIQPKKRVLQIDYVMAY